LKNIFISLLFISVLWSSDYIKGYSFHSNGEDNKAQRLNQLFNKVEFENSIEFDKDGLLKAIKSHKKYLRLKQKYKKNINHRKSKLDLEKMINVLNNIETIAKKGEFENSKFEFYQIDGEDSKGNVLYTGYYTPVMKVSSKKNKVYKYPLYKRPQNSKYTREHIDFYGALKNKNLEIAYTNNRFDNYIIHIEGSSIVKDIATNNLYYLANDGKNGYPYTSIGKYLVNSGKIEPSQISTSSIRNWLNDNRDKEQLVYAMNQSYSFFRMTKEAPKGAMNAPLTKDYSIAVDTSIIPLGAVLVGKVPVLDSRGKLKKYEYRILFAQDKGGAIKGSGHIDLYFGVNEKIDMQVGGLKHYGKLWLLMPKES
jgi:membrane-bound lytic murein transglycosylase A